VKLKEEN